jgi:hypothetical protein
VGNNGDRLSIVIDETMYLFQNASFKLLETFARRGGYVRKAIDPPPRVLTIQLFDLRPTQAFPFAEVNLPQSRTKR